MNWHQGQKKRHSSLEPSRGRREPYRQAFVYSVSVWRFFMRVARHPLTRVVVLILLMMLQMVLLWLLGLMVDLCVSLMELWVELARKHLELTL